MARVRYFDRLRSMMCSVEDYEALAPGLPRDRAQLSLIKAKFARKRSYRYGAIYR
jgi:hypothetical protein